MAPAKKEKPTLLGFRVYSAQRAMVKKLAKKKGVSEAQVIRMAIETMFIKEA